MLETTHTLRVRFGETDAFGIVFYANFYVYFDVAVIELMRAGPYDFTEMRASGFGVPVVESGARFLAPLLADDEIAIATRVTEVRARSFRVEHEVYREELKIATGFSIRAFSSYSTELEKIVLADMPTSLRTYLSG
jgi:YbgC/YbaW family acyl-CoA thioester hydrolase